jgi:hypothetical protein
MTECLTIINPAATRVRRAVMGRDAAEYAPQLCTSSAGGRSNPPGHGRRTLVASGFADDDEEPCENDDWESEDDTNN